MSVLPPPQQESVVLNDAAPAQPAGRPDAHTQKYDRQLRLWASTGQKALETASILVVNATATAASTLKNLVLPGIGKFTILDEATVTSADVGSNFFLEQSSIGKPRAEEVVRLLQELNSDVTGMAVVKSLKEVLAEMPASLAEYTLIIAVDVDPPELRTLAELAWAHLIPFIKVKSCGFFASLRVQVQEIPLVETHPEDLIDLRIHHPFPALLEYASTFEYDTMDSATHSHVPAIIILIKALEKWKSAHGGKGPTGSEERNAFAAGVMKEQRNPDEENFDEAVTLFRRAGVKPPIPRDIQQLFTDPSCEHVTSSSPNFWLLLRAVRDFVSHPSSSALLPLSGALPDMKADSAGYVGLQGIYRTRAKEDILLVKQLLKEVLRGVGLAHDTIGDEEIETFVKHSAFLRVVRGRSLKEEAEAPLIAGQIETIWANSSFSETPDDTLNIYLGFQASDIFFETLGRYPGTDPSDDDGTLDIYPLTQIATALLKRLGCDGLSEERREPFENVLHEICRSGAADLPQIAALLGGLVAQEAIKLVTKQYVPLAATCVYNGVRSTTGIVDA